ncbi:4-carboxymuconolactone decarboxylase [Mycena olivaceomarginata]|nr:4-carboxymuconolactone decarboxylase [Mycena olivaceomarginata]
MFPLKPLTLALLCFIATLAPGEVDSKPRGRTMAKRDDNLPARVPYVFPPPGTDPIADAIRARRTNGTLLDLDGVLLNAPLFAQSHSNLFGVIRSNNTIPGNMRELIILRVIVLNNATYEWIQHEPVARMEGLTTEQLLVVRLGATILHWITQNIRVPDDVFDAMRPFLNDSQLVEAVSTAVGYNAGSRLVLALNVDAKMDVPVPIPM